MLSGIDVTALAWLTLAGVVLDWLCGEPARWHPLVGFGRLAAALERRLNRQPGTRGGRARGMLGWALAVLPLVALAAAITYWLGQCSFWLAAAWHAVLLYFCLGLRSLREHVLPIAQSLQQGDLAGARLLTARIVSRDTTQLQETGLAKAAIESVLENGNDAVFGTLFWFAVAGGPGALLFRLSNTLDAMWGYRTPRLQDYGWTAAKLDDLWNWLPARLTAFSYAALGHWHQARSCWRTQAPAWSSPNAGPVMAAGAGALGLLLGGAEIYHGQLEQRPALGAGRAPVAADIRRGWLLVARSVCLWLAALLLLAGVAALARASLAAGGMHA